MKLFLLVLLHEQFRSSRSEGFCKKGVCKNFTKCRGKHQCQGLFFSCSRPATLIKKRLWYRFFSVHFAKVFRIHLNRAPAVAASGSFLQVLYWKVVQKSFVKFWNCLRILSVFSDQLFQKNLSWMISVFKGISTSCFCMEDF